MNLPFTLDCETVPLEASLALPYPAEERQPPGNMTKPETIAVWRSRDIAKWEAERVKECSLDPRLGRIVCIGWTMDAGSPAVISAETEADEAPLLRVFWDLARSTQGRVVTWNGSWDLRFIVLRSMALGVAPTLPPDVIRSWFQKYRYAPHFDVKAALTNWNPTDGHLDSWCQFLGVAGKTEGVDGSKVYDLYREGKFSEIAAYCSQDVRSTYELYRRVSPFFAAEAA